MNRLLKHTCRITGLAWLWRRSAYLAAAHGGWAIRVAWPLTAGALISYGAYSIYRPAGPIAAGTLMILDLLDSRRRPKPPST